MAFIKADKKRPEPFGIRGRKFSEEKKEELEKKLTAYLRQNPKATREKCAKHLGVIPGYVTTMTAWKNRQGGGGESRRQDGTSLPKSMQKIGLDMAIEEQGVGEWRESERQEQEQAKKEASIKKLTREQKQDERSRKIEINTP